MIQEASKHSSQHEVELAYILIDKVQSNCKAVLVLSLFNISVSRT